MVSLTSNIDIDINNAAHIGFSDAPAVLVAVDQTHLRY